MIAVATSLKIGEGDEYDLRPGAPVVTDAVVVSWRLNALLDAGFDMADAEALAVRADVDVHDVAKWLSQGATHRLVLQIVLPLA